MGLMDKAKAVIRLCRLNKPFLAIPFAVTAAFISNSKALNYVKLFWLICAVVFGFMAGNAFNGLTDLDIDIINPRTKDRPLVKGDLSIKNALIIMIVSTIMVIISTWFINPFYVLLLPIPMFFCFVYSISKRYTYLCHVILGITNAACPVGSWIVFNDWQDFRCILLGIVVFFWTIGFEIIYSSQDVLYDRIAGMKSIPVVFGISNAYKISTVCHIIMAIVFLFLMYICNVGLVFVTGFIISMVIIVKEHWLISNNKNYNAGKTFDLNQVFSLTIMFAAILDKLIFINI